MSTPGRRASARRRWPFAILGSVALAGCERSAEEPADPPAAVPTAVEATAEPEGIIRGQLSFPSDYLPEDIQVCAREIEGAREVCSSERDGDRYELAVPPGTYVVWASTLELPGVRAHYTEAVRCGLEVSCTDHSPIEVSVGAGAQVSGVDPGDWYADN